ncbi:MAG: OmpA family protein [Limnohabitans sp.]|jgi:outer membrane protein OmpA-like peptidoglycan-associated protein|nr:OmpA family protein [Limnohabitans sp.]
MKRLLFSLALIFSFAPAFAQLVQQASKEDLIDKLTPPAPPTTRSLRNLAPKPVTVDLSINFDFDSARLQASSKPLLNNLAQAMTSERLSALKFKVEGHTDAKGKNEYNQELSARRALAVQAYLIDQNVAAERLQAEGKGASELLVPEKPLASENRRVRITLLP